MTRESGVKNVRKMEKKEGGEDDDEGEGLDSEECRGGCAKRWK